MFLTAKYITFYLIILVLSIVYINLSSKTQNKCSRQESKDIFSIKSSHCKVLKSIIYKAEPRIKRSIDTGDVNYRIASETDTSTKKDNVSSFDNIEHVNKIDHFKKTWPVQRWRDYGMFTDDYLDLLNEHWLQFPPPSETVQRALGSFYILFVTVGLFGNCMVLFMYIRCRSLRTPGNILVVNLALSDSLMLTKTPLFIFNSFNYGPALGKAGCVAYGFLGGLSGTTSIATLAAIALDRYWAVVRPLEPLRALTAVRARCFAVSSWIYAAIFSSIPAFDIGYGRYVPEGFLTSCSFDYLTDELPPRYFIFVFFCAAWVVPFCTISFCYLNILRVVVFNRNVAIRNQEQRLSSRHIKAQTKRKAEVKLSVLVIAVIAMFFLSWTPYAIVSLLGIFGKKELVTPIVSVIPALFCKTAACINPYIYIINHPNFRKELRKIFNRKKQIVTRGTIQTISNTVNERRRSHRSSDLSSIDVEVIEMRDIPFSTAKTVEGPAKIRTVAEKTIEREASLKSISMKSLEEEMVPPPSWFVKPKFSKKRSFKKQSIEGEVSSSTDPV